MPLRCIRYMLEYFKAPNRLLILELSGQQLVICVASSAEEHKTSPGRQSYPELKQENFNLSKKTYK